MIQPDKDSAQVTIPPPLVALGVVVLAVVIKFVFPSEFLPASLRWLLGVTLSISGFGAVATCVSLFKRHQNAVPPWKTTTILFDDGPYQYSRNPIYLGGMVLVAGLLFIVNSAVAFLLLIPLFLFLDRYVIPKEEGYLLKKFGESYQDYFNSTRRWFGRKDE